MKRYPPQSTPFTMSDVCNLQMGLKFYSRLILDQWEVCMVLMSFNIKKIFYKKMIRRLNRYVLSWMQLRMQCQRRFDESDLNRLFRKIPVPILIEIILYPFKYKH